MNEGQQEWFKVAVGSLDLFTDTLNSFNFSYKTNFTIKSVEDWDGVEFAMVNINDASVDDIFLFGSYFGVAVHIKRKSGEIDF
jgi:hypothetical protein